MRIALPTSLSPEGGETKPTSLYRVLKDAILSGQLRDGSKMPTERDYAGMLGVSRGTVNTAYTRLRDEGYIASRIGDGTYVCALTKAARSQPPLSLRRHRGQLARDAKDFDREKSHLFNPRGPAIPFRVGQPAVDLFPFKTWYGYLRDMPTAIAHSLSENQPPEGFLRLRRALSEHVLLSRGIRCSPEQLIITNGAQQSQSLLLRTLCDRGDRVALEDPGYPGSIASVRSAGLLPVPIPVDDDGLKVDVLEKQTNIRAVIVSPTHQFPLGSQLSLVRRIALLRWAQINRAWIIEDDYDGEFQYQFNAIPSLRSIDKSGSVIYIGSFSKTLFPSVRLGYIIANDQVTTCVANAKAVLDRFTAMDSQWCLVRFMETGGYARHLKKMRDLYMQRRDAFVEAVAPIFKNAPINSNVGLYLSLDLAKRCNDVELSEAAANANIDVAPISAFCVNQRKNGLLFGFAGFDERQTRASLSRLAPVVEKLYLT